MNTRRSRAFTIAIGVAIAALCTSEGRAQFQGITPPLVPVGPAVLAPPPPIFYLRSYLGKCLDFGPPARPASSHEQALTQTQLVIYECNAEASQQVRIVEVDSQHDVILQAGSQVIGIHNPMVNTLGGSSGNTAPLQFGLELQNRAKRDTVFSGNQIFAIDGDSIILAANRTLAVQVQNSRGANWSPVVVAPRNLADSEFWDFNQIDGADIDPTKGFVRAGYPGNPETAYDTLLARLRPWDGGFCQNASRACQASPATPGTVIKIYPGTDINLTGLAPLQIPTGVTIRGSRRATLFGPILHMDSATPGESMLEIAGDDIRITGLRLQGTSRSTAKDQPASKGIFVNNSFVRSVIDHNDISNWTNDGVFVRGNDTLEKNSKCDDGGQANDPLNRPYDAFVARNFIHHNEMQDYGYGVEANSGGYPLIAANTFYLNRHSIAVGYGTAHSGYHAWFNLVLSDSPEQTTAGVSYHTHDFDMHGTDGNGFGGLGGDYVQIYRNTFLGKNRPNYELRGHPCNNSDFYGNESLESASDAISFKLSLNPFSLAHGGWPFNVGSNPEQFHPNGPNPTDHLGVGDFDGDGVQDLFFATGAAWYYAPQGAAEWRFLSAKTDRMDTLLFGDFDGDGRRDVVAKNGNDLMVSWGGASEWEKLNSINAPITDLAVGKFGAHLPGDRRDDLFWADGQSWYLSSGGSALFQAVNTSSTRIPDLRFGDFDGDGRTDVFAIMSGKWQVSYSATSGWTPLPVSLTKRVDGLVVADFDGDGRADIGASNHRVVNGVDYGWQWLFSRSGASEWTYRWPGPPASSPQQWSVPLSSAVAIGFFDSNPGADVLLWGSANNGRNDLSIVSGGLLQGPASWPQQSRQQMR